MELTHRIGRTDTPREGIRGCPAAVCVAGVDEAGLSDEGLRTRLRSLVKAESCLAALKSRALAELSRRHSAADAQRLARDELGASGREAKRDVETAQQLAELPATREALESGEIPQGHARLIARAAGESPVDEELLAEVASGQRFDDFAKTVKRHQQDVADDDGKSLVERQRSKRKARIFESSESGMFVLTAEFDQINGARIATALTAREGQLWKDEDPKNRATPPQRMADALLDLICNSEGSHRGSVGTDLLVIADFDIINKQLGNPRLADGSPVPATELHRLGLEANIIPSIFDVRAQNLWLGRKQRATSQAQRVVLTARDQGCIGCGANPLWCRIHHISWWSKGGSTDVENLVLVCDACHHKIHDQGWQVHKNPDSGKYTLKSATKANKQPVVAFSRSSVTKVTISCDSAPPSPIFCTNDAAQTRTQTCNITRAQPGNTTHTSDPTTQKAKARPTPAPNPPEQKRSRDSPIAAQEPYIISCEFTNALTSNPYRIDFMAPMAQMTEVRCFTLADEVHESLRRQTIEHRFEPVEHLSIETVARAVRAHLNAAYHRHSAGLQLRESTSESI